MAYADKNVGARGVIRCEVTQMSQNKAANTSSVRVRGYIWLSSGGPSGDETGNCKASFTGTNSSGVQSGSFGYISAPTKVLILERTYTVTHGSDGTKTVSYTFNFGPTITSNFGSGGSVTCTTTLTPILKSPAQPSPPLAISAGGGSANVSWVAPAQGGAAIDLYRLRYANSSLISSPNAIDVDTPGLNITIENLTANTTWYFWLAAHNIYGWSSWSGHDWVYIDIKGPWVKNAGVWKETQAYVKVDGVWRMADSYIKSGGVWKPL